MSELWRRGFELELLQRSVQFGALGAAAAIQLGSMAQLQPQLPCLRRLGSCKLYEDDD